MATKMRIEDRFECSADEFYELLASQEFDNALMDGIGVGKTILSFEETDEGSSLRVKLAPKVDLPRFMKKVIGGAYEYTELRVWTRANLGNTWKIEPTFKAGKVDINGTLTITPDGDGRCLRVVEGTFSVGLPLIGGKIEKFIIKQTEESFAKNATYTTKYLADKK